VEAPPPDVGEDIRRQEEEELQRVLELSMQDKGGRSWAGYSPSPGASSSRDNLPVAGAAAASSSSKAQPTTKAQPTQPTGGYAASSSRRAVDVVHDSPQQSADVRSSAAPVAVEAPYKQVSKPIAAPVAEAPMSVLPVITTSVPAASITPQPIQATIPDLATATRVRALHNFEPAAAGELAFEKGDVIKVVDRTHKDWWKGQLKGRTGIFPVNYVVCTKCVRLFWFNVHFRRRCQNLRWLISLEKRRPKRQYSLRQPISIGF
jgi:signal transducing adaptor molecule